MKESLAADATLADIVATHHRPCDFIANVLAIMRRAERERGPVIARLGVMGAGKLPNFRIDSAQGDWSLGVFDGVSFKQFDPGMKEANWSSKGMIFKEVENLLRSLRNYKS